MTYKFSADSDSGGEFKVGLAVGGLRLSESASDSDAESAENLQSAR